jgi:hypothetical protein
VRLALALCALFLLAPAVALARKPVISYVDENGVFRLYDSEPGTEVEPPPAVPANFLGFRYGISLNGRYIVFNDAGKRLHLLDRATSTEIPLPGIDVYTAVGPGGLTVSDTGRIAFDNNGNGPALVYESATSRFLDTGLAADNGHRQTRLSGDGHFLATTCDDSGCIANLSIGVDPYVQDLASKLDTGFPSDATADEEHPCLNADGSVLGLDKRPSLLDMEKDIFLFDRSVSPPQPITITGVNTANEPDELCVLDAAGEYLGYFDNNTAFRVLQIASGEFLTLPSDKEFDNRSLFSAPYSPAQPPPTGGGAPAPPPPGDRTKPVLSRVRMTHRRFRVRRRATAFRFTLSEPARMRIVIRRLGRLAGQIRRRGLPAGSNRIAWGGRLRGRRVRPGAYAAVLIATDAAGNRSLPRLIEFRVLRPRR